ncbi:hypothetical protein F4778DRAFT_782618 [Xylariomycetidae sp. FL2044]|nr:hypothetical protein F4778DRAFT_782618 [Xylariomycetidae sp. FL2044]
MIPCKQVDSVSKTTKACSNTATTPTNNHPREQPESDYELINWEGEPFDLDVEWSHGSESTQELAEVGDKILELLDAEIRIRSFIFQAKVLEKVKKEQKKKIERTERILRVIIRVTAAIVTIVSIRLLIKGSRAIFSYLFG